MQERERGKREAKFPSTSLTSSLPRPLLRSRIWHLVCACVLCATWIDSARADTIWQKTLHGLNEEEREVEAAIERVLLGYGDERDLLRVRVALITLSRGEIRDPHSVVLLVRLRREMGLMPASTSERLLSEGLEAELSLTERAWAYFEKAHLSLRERDLRAAEANLNEALSFAWRSSHRAEVLVLRGFVLLRAGDDERALADFGAIGRQSAPRRVLVEAHIGRALAFAERGDAYRVEAEARLAYLVESSRASVSRLDPFWDLSLTAWEQRAARALLLWGKAAHLQSVNPDAANLSRQNACLMLRPASATLEETRLSSDSRESEPAMTWGREAVAALRSLWEEACSRPLAPEEGGSTHENGPEPTHNSPLPE